MKNAQVYGSPGIRVRMLGLAGIYWPYLLFLLLIGWMLGCIVPIEIPSPVAALVLLAIAFLSWFLSKSCSHRFSLFMKGARGEELVAQQLAFLPAGWGVVHSVPRSGIIYGGGDYDHVVVAPGAIYVIETKNWAGPVTIENGNVYVGGRPTSHSPIAQARQEAIDLAAFLQNVVPAGTPVAGIVCFASNGLAEDCVRVDDTVVCNLRVLCDVLRNGKYQPFDENHRSLIIDRLLSASR